MASNRGRTGPAWNRARARALRPDANGQVICAWCNQPIDMTLSGKHPDGPTADHPLALEDGGDLLAPDLAPMHLRCNSAKENERRAERRREHNLNASRAW